MSNTAAVGTGGVGKRITADAMEAGRMSRRRPRALKLLSVPGLWVFSGAFVFILFCLFRLSGVPIWMDGDQAIWLQDGQRMFFGEVLYRDFFQMTFPGTDLLYLWAFKIFGLRNWIPNALLVVVGATLTWLIYFISRRVLSARGALVPPLFFLTLVFRGLLDASHHWLSILCCAGAVAVLVDGRTPRRLFFAGLLCGLAACFTQSHGVALLAGLAAFLFFERQTSGERVVSVGLVGRFGILAGGFLLAVLAISLPFVWWAGVRRFLFCTAVYVARYYSAFGEGSNWRGYMIGLPGKLEMHVWYLGAFLLIHLLLPLIYVLALLRYQRGTLTGDRQRMGRLLLIIFSGLFLFLSVAAGPSWNRLYYVSFPALILFGWLLENAGTAGRLVLDATLCGTVLLAMSIPVRVQLHTLEYMDLPGERTAFLHPERIDRYRWLMAQTHPLEYVFSPFSPDYYFLLRLRNPATVPVVSPSDFTRPEDVTSAIEGLERHQVRLVMWAAELDLPKNPATDHLGPLRAYLREHYCAAKNFDDEEVLVRTEHRSANGACPGLVSVSRRE